MNWVKLNKMPVVLEIINEAEHTIFLKTGEHVRLRIAYTNYKPENKDALVEILKDLVCETYEVTWKDIIGKSRSKQVVQPRHVFAFICQEVLKMIPRHTGELLNRDRTTSIHSRDLIRGYYEVNDPFIKSVDRIIKQLQML